MTPLRRTTNSATATTRGTCACHGPAIDVGL